MRRWNGWGAEDERIELAPSAAALLRELVGAPSPSPDAPLAAVVAAVPASRLPAHPLVTADPLDRVRHARGQSLPDWVALRSGRIGPVPDGIARPTSAAEVRELLSYAGSVGAEVIPYGGGTSVVGGIAPREGRAPTLTVDLERLSGLAALDDRSALATVGAGTSGPALEGLLAPRGWRLGHYPQSWERSTVGGWVATRSSGAESLGYGRIEALFAGGRLEAPAGTLELPPHPASAAGPDLRQLVLGSEGRLGILTEATLRLTPLPELELTSAWFLPDLDRALEATRTLGRARLGLTMLRLSTPAETMTTLGLAGSPRRTGLLARYLRLRGLGTAPCLLLVGAAGRRRVVRAALAEVRGIVRGAGGVGGPGGLGRRWSRERFRTPSLRDTLWDAGYAVDTLETAVAWARVPALVEALGRTLGEGLADEGERVHAFVHLSHVYPTGSSLYATYVFRRSADPDVTLRRWGRLKGAASRAIVEAGGTISHQHGVGTDHRPYLEAEKGSLGLAALGDAVRRFDPDGRMNPGKLLP